MIRRLCLPILLSLCIAGCVSTPPIEEYTIAREAFEAAQRANAAHFAPGFWHKAEDAYQDAEKNFEDREYDKARSLFLQAKTFSEKAENAARLKSNQTGETF